MVWPWVGRAGVFLMGAAGALWGHKKLLALALTFGAVVVKRDDIANWGVEKKDDIIDSGKNTIIAAAGAGIGVVLLLLLITSRRGGD